MSVSKLSSPIGFNPGANSAALQQGAAADGNGKKKTKIINAAELNDIEWSKLLKQGSRGREPDGRRQKQRFICGFAGNLQFSAMTESEIIENGFVKLSISEIKKISKETLKKSALLPDSMLSPQIFKDNVELMSSFVAKIERANMSRCQIFLRTAAKIAAYFLAACLFPLFGLGYLIYEKVRNYENLLSTDKRHVGKKTGMANLSSAILQQQPSIMTRIIPGILKAVVREYNTPEKRAQVLQVTESVLMNIYNKHNEEVLKKEENAHLNVVQFEKDAGRGTNYIRRDAVLNIYDGKPIIATAKDNSERIEQLARPIKELMISENDKQNNRWEVALQTVINQSLMNGSLYGFIADSKYQFINHLWQENGKDTILQPKLVNGVPTIFLDIQRDNEQNITSVKVEVNAFMNLVQEAIGGNNVSLNSDIEHRIHHALQSDSSLSPGARFAQITADASGNVTLSGTIENENEREAVEIIVRNVNGVKNIVNHLNISNKIIIPQVINSNIALILDFDDNNELRMTNFYFKLKHNL